MSDHRDYLRRLTEEHYRGFAMVHWSMTTEERRTGWLGEHAHAAWRETLLHTCARYEVAVPVYCLMPDHAHVLLAGLSMESDQRRGMSFLRRYSAPMFASPPPNGAEAPLRLPEIAWQKQGYDHVLREQERDRNGFSAVACYIAENPVRAGLVSRAQEWKFSGSLICGYPDLDWRREDFWERWWTIFAKAADAEKS